MQKACSLGEYRHYLALPMVAPSFLALEADYLSTSVAEFRSGLGARPKLKGWWQVRHAPGELAGVQGWVAGTLAAVDRLPRRCPRRVWVAVPGRIVLTRFFALDNAAESGRQEVIQEAAGADDALEVLGSERLVQGAGTLQVAGVLGRRETLDALVRGLEQRGMAVHGVRPSWWALWRLFRSAERLADRPVWIIWVGSGCVTLLWLAAPQVFARSFLLQEPPGDPESPAFEELIARVLFELKRTGLYLRARPDWREPDLCLVGGRSDLSERIIAAVQARSGIETAGAESFLDQELGRETLIAAGLAAGVSAGGLNLISAGMRAAEARRRSQTRRLAATLAAGLVLAPASREAELRRHLAERSRASAASLATVRITSEAIRRDQARIAEIAPALAASRSFAERRANWGSLLTDLQERLAQVDDVWLERLRMERIAAQEIPVTGTGKPLLPNFGTLSHGRAPGERVVLHLTGRLLDVEHPRERASAEAYRRAKALLSGLAESGWVAAVEQERFDPATPGILRFDFVLSLKPEAAL